MFDLLQPEQLMSMLSTAAQTEIGEWMIKATIIFLFINRKFKKHFGSMEDAVKNIGEQLTTLRTTVDEKVSELSDAIKTLEKTAHSRIADTNERVSRISDRLKIVEARQYNDKQKE